MRSLAGEEGTCPLVMEARLGERTRGPQRGERAGKRGQRKPPAEELQQAARDRHDEPSVNVCVAPKLCGRRVDVTLERHRRPVIERMRARCRRLDPLHTDADALERKRRARERMERRADVVAEAGQCQLRCSATAADYVRGFVHDVGIAWLSLGIAGLIFRVMQLWATQGLLTGIAWATKIITDPFHDIALYRRAPLQLLRRANRAQENL